MPSLSVPLFHRDYGGAGLPPLVILHGMLGSSRNWQSTGQDLSVRFHVFAVDLRNHGGSPHGEPMTYEAMAGDVAGWLDERGLERVTLMGHSMGGKVAMLLACREPGRVARLVVVDVAPKNYHWVANRESFAAMNELDLSTLPSRAAAERKMQTRVASWAMRQFLLTNLGRDETGKWKWLIDLPVMTAALPTLEANPMAPGDRYSGPTLVIAGNKSDYVRPEDRTAILDHFPAARIEIIGSAGHNPHIEAREEFVLTVLSTIAATPRENPPKPPTH